MTCRTRRATAFLWMTLGLGVAVFTAPAHSLDLNGFFPGKGVGHAAMSVTFEGYDEFWRGTQRVMNPGVGEVDITTYSLYLDYGITDRLAVVANLPSVDAASNGTGGFGDSQLQDITVFLKQRVASFGTRSHRHHLLVAGGFCTPVSDYEANIPVDVGDGTTDFLARFIYQFETDRFYLSQQIGYDLRGEDAPDGLPLYTEIGIRRGSFLVGGFVSHYLAQGGTDIGDTGFTFPSNQEEFTRAGAKVYAELGERLGVSGYLFTTLDGRNTGNTSGASFGLVARF